MILLLKFATYNKTNEYFVHSNRLLLFIAIVHWSLLSRLSFFLFIYLFIRFFKTQRICGTANTINNHNLISYLSRRIKKKENKLKYKQRTFKLDWILYWRYLSVKNCFFCCWLLLKHIYIFFEFKILFFYYIFQNVKFFFIFSDDWNYYIKSVIQYRDNISYDFIN